MKRLTQFAVNYPVTILMFVLGVVLLGYISFDKLGIDYIEGGWPGANPNDDEFFANPPALSKAKLAAFGMTRRSGRSAENDTGLAGLLGSGAGHICLVGKSWDKQVKSALGISEKENLFTGIGGYTTKDSLL